MSPIINHDYNQVSFIEGVQSVITGGAISPLVFLNAYIKNMVALLNPTYSFALSNFMETTIKQNAKKTTK